MLVAMKHYGGVGLVAPRIAYDVRNQPPCLLLSTCCQ